MKGSQFLKKDRTLTNMTDFMAGGAILFHFLRKRSSAGSRSTIQAEVHSSFVTCFAANSSFWQVEKFFLSIVNSIALC